MAWSPGPNRLSAMRTLIDQLPASKIREVANAAMGRADVLAFWFGESDEPTPQFIRDAATRSIAEGETFYSHNLGLPELREAIARYASSLHPAVVTIPAALATAELQGSTGEELLTAIVAGYEVACRLGRALDPQQAYAKGFHPTAVVGPFAAAAATAVRTSCWRAPSVAAAAATESNSGLTWAITPSREATFTATTRSSSVTCMSRWRRITTDGRGVTQAAAARRDPPSSLRWSRGWASEKERALTSLREARKTRKSISSWSEPATAGPSMSVPSTNSRRTLS